MHVFSSLYTIKIIMGLVLIPVALKKLPISLSDSPTTDIIYCS